MSDPTPQPPTTHEAVEPMLAGHALGTLEARDAAAVDAHLATCASCRVTLDEFAAASALVELQVHEAGAVDRRFEAAAVDLRSSIVARARVTPQDAGTGGATPAPTSVARRPVRPSVLRRLLRGRGMSFGAVAALGVTVAALLMQSSDDRDRIASLEHRLRDAKGDQVTTLRGSQVSDLDVSGPFGDARAQVVLQRDAGVVAFRNIPAPPDEMVWQVWQVDSRDRLTSLGVIDAAREAAFLPLQDIDADELERIFVTTEPAGGSSEPTAKELVEGSV